MTLNQRFTRAAEAGGVRSRRPTLALDPRIRQRRATVRREEGRRRLWLVAMATTLTLLVGAMWAVVRSPLLDVDRVTVQGAAHTGRATVLAASGIGPGRAMADVAEKESARAVEALPWVSDAVVSREWPGTVHITVVERSPVAVTRTVAESWGLLDISGRVLAWTPTRPPELPLVAGIPPAGAPATRVDDRSVELLRVARAVPAPLVPRLAGIAARGQEVELDLLPQGTVRLGPPETAPDKVSVVDAILGRVDPAHVATIDARFPSTAVLTRR